MEIVTEIKKCFRLNDMLDFNVQYYLENKKPTFPNLDMVSVRLRSKDKQKWKALAIANY